MHIRDFYFGIPSSHCGTVGVRNNSLHYLHKNGYKVIYSALFYFNDRIQSSAVGAPPISLDRPKQEFSVL